jgi:hypothetical protein
VGSAVASAVRSKNKRPCGAGDRFRGRRAHTVRFRLQDVVVRCLDGLNSGEAFVGIGLVNVAFWLRRRYFVEMTVQGVTTRDVTRETFRCVPPLVRRSPRNSYFCGAFLKHSPPERSELSLGVRARALLATTQPARLPGKLEVEFSTLGQDLTALLTAVLSPEAKNRLEI